MNRRDLLRTALLALASFLPCGEKRENLFADFETPGYIVVMTQRLAAKIDNAMLQHCSDEGVLFDVERLA